MRRGHRPPCRCEPLPFPRGQLSAPALPPVRRQTGGCRTRPGVPCKRSVSGRAGGRRSLRSSMTRNSSSGTRVSALVGKAVKAQLAASPPCDSTSARDVGSSSVKCVSSARLCRALDAVRCQPGLSPGAGRVVWSAGAVASTSSSFAQVGAGKPSERRKRAACFAARVLGGVPLAVASSSGRRRVARTPGWSCRSARAVSAQELQ